MKPFINDDFILTNKTARRLFHSAAKQMPIIDFHNHLDPQKIWEDGCYDNIAEVWLGGDHYKWRAMRANGVPEELVTGDGDPYEKFLAWADTVQNCIGNPLYHWTHLELKRYFGIEETLSPASADRIWNLCNEKLKSPEYSVRNLLRMQNVEILCTTDDPIDDLKWHRKLAGEDIGFSVLPTFRPGRALDIEKADFAEYIAKLAEVAGIDASGFEGLKAALVKRLDYFVENGCKVTDHSLESAFFLPATAEEVDRIYRDALAGKAPSESEAAMYRGALMTALGKEYADRGLVMQLHIGAIRNNSTRLFKKLGADIGCDSSHDFNYAPQLSALMDAMDLEDKLPRTILYYLNPKDAAMLATMAGNYQSNDEGIRGKVQLGTAWWLCDHKNGMEYQMDSLADVGLISTFIGMLTDSRSFLSFPRHEYFRRILCNKIGTWVENGEYPEDFDYLEKLVRGIAHDNAKDYFRF